MTNPYEYKSENSAEAVTETERQYKSAITVPVFGKIPIYPSDMIADLKVRENPPLWAQFFKYVVFGFISSGVLLGVYLVARKFYGGYISDDLPKETLKEHLAYVMFIGFVLANIVAYTTNRIFVFTPSMRHWTLEFGIFLLVSGASFNAGNYAQDWFIDAGLNKDVAALSFAVSSALVNFIARKYIVFAQPSTDVIYTSN
jgi:putative flippase GtrA